MVQGQVFSSVTTVSGVPAESYTQATSFGSQIISYPAISPTSSHGGEISNPNPANCTLKTSVPSVSASIVVLNGTITRFYFDGSGPYVESKDKTVTLYTTTIVNSYTCSPPPTPEPSTYASIFGIALVGFGGVPQMGWQEVIIGFNPLNQRIASVPPRRQAGQTAEGGLHLTLRMEA